MPSAQSNGTTSVASRAHQANMNQSTWTWAGWVKRTGAGESDFRLFNKAAGTAIGSPNITGQGGALTRLRGRHSAGGGGGFDLSITADGALPLDTWVCLFAVAGLGGTPNIRIFKWDGVSAVTEMSYSSTSNSGAALSFNTADLTFFNTTDGSQCFAGKAAHWVSTDDVWSNADMVAFATGTIPSGITDHYWPMQTDLVDAGQVAGWDMTGSNVTFDPADSPPVTYGGGGINHFGTVTDTSTANDLAQPAQDFVRTISEVSAATDGTDLSSIEVVDTFTETATAGDSIEVTVTAVRDLSETATATDVSAGAQGGGTDLVDGAAGQDSTATEVTAVRELVDTATAFDTLTAALDVPLVLAETSTGHDVVVSVLSTPSAPTVDVSFTVEPTRVRAHFTINGDRDSGTRFTVEGDRLPRRVGAANRTGRTIEPSRTKRSQAS